MAVAVKQIAAYVFTGSKDYAPDPAKSVLVEINSFHCCLCKIFCFVVQACEEVFPVLYVYHPGTQQRHGDADGECKVEGRAQPGNSQVFDHWACPFANDLSCDSAVMGAFSFPFCLEHSWHSFILPPVLSFV
ncbi:hypothetical protein PSCICF_25850 [Pseudomonas cichorii]|nr:hypothetical protein PSCICF_25850 [Pseudomonas cichorii]